MKGILVTIDQPILSSFSVVFKDFSKSGAGLFVREPVGIQRLVRVSIDGADFPPLEGRVVWCGPIKDDERADAKDFLFRVGVDFMPRDDEARENQLAIYTYLRSLFERENAE